MFSACPKRPQSGKWTNVFPCLMLFNCAMILNMVLLLLGTAFEAQIQAIEKALGKYELSETPYNKEMM